jgi:hypothetical protein
MRNNTRLTQESGSTASDVDLPNVEPTYLDRLYIQFGQGMTYSQHTMFQQLSRDRKDYLFDLWLKKKGYV